MNQETRIPLLNYDWLVRNRGLDEVELALDNDAVVIGDGGVMPDELCRSGFTPATNDLQ